MVDKLFSNELSRSIAFSYQRFFIIALSVFVEALTCSAFLNICFDIDTKLSKELKAYGANVTIEPKNDKELILNQDYEEGKKNLKVGALTPFLYTFLNSGSTNGVVLGTDFRALKITKPFVEAKEGSFSLSDFDENSAFLGINLSEQLGLKVSNELQIYNPENGKITKPTIKGILLSDDELDSIVLAPLSVVRNLSDTFGIQYANVVVYGNFDGIDTKIKNINNESINAKPISSAPLNEGLVLDKIRALVPLTILVVLIIVTTSVNTTLSSIIFSREKEIALRLALGAKKSEILRLLTCEYLIISLSASIIGAFCGIFLANVFGYLISNTSIDFRFKAIPMALIASLFFAFLAAFFPIEKALEINVCRNLKGE